MKATEAKLLDFIKKSPQFVIPIYQRTYSWTAKECRQLWDDVLRAGSNDDISVHFVGSIVYIEQGLSQVTHQSPLLVIDGQQRLTTATLLVAALANAVGEEEPIEGFSAEMLKGYYLMNPLEKGERKFKLLLSQTDKETLTAIVANHEPPSESSLRVTQNYELFQEMLEGCKGDYVAVCKGLAKLVVVDIALNRDQDNPQLIFESMNSTGKELSQADLIRNYILMGLEPELQTHLYDQYWRPMENEFGQEAYGTHFDAFMRHYLTVKTGDIPRLKEVYEAFKTHACSKKVAEAGVEALVKEIRESARNFCCMALGLEKDPQLKVAFNDLRELKVDVAFPLLLELYGDYANGLLSKDDLLSAVRLIEAYVFRRAVCAIPTNSMNKTFATFNKALRKESYLESLKAHFLKLPSYRRFPSDEEFSRDLSIRDLYNFRSRSYWLRRIENYKRKELVAVDEYTIEHIMPQNENLSIQWQEDLGDEWERVQHTWLHTLGNLTLTAYNSSYSDRPFAEKRDMPKAPEKGLKQSPLNLNQGLGFIEKWDELTIQDRAKKLAGIATKVWQAPSLPQEVLETYQPKRDIPQQYSISDHPNLITPEMKPLFELLRKEILALDPCVNEEFLKYYVAYKAETNFVDVIPRAKFLHLTLNMKFKDVIDPKQKCIDVTNIGRWGNGDVRYNLKTENDIPYAIGLVRQSLDQQLGNGNEE
ncbi:hypothetical protein Mal35_13670 [Gimesia maris]|uniref:DUF262 and DUF1524 domain-containing protein n=1 Tax=Gimesia maris TaxID=122 RepID=UPI001188BFA7|nr:DUF262 and DUF1524 domain-containing protein [Gimesia maris]QDT77938.1 hypothetical protein Mal35_13670 [Gimesia maris]